MRRLKIYQAWRTTHAKFFGRRRLVVEEGKPPHERPRRKCFKRWGLVAVEEMKRNDDDLKFLSKIGVFVTNREELGSEKMAKNSRASSPSSSMEFLLLEAIDFVQVDKQGLSDWMG